MNNPRAFPRAFTLVEMMVSISVGSVLMALALGMVHRTMRTESTANRIAKVERTAARLSRQFRHDIHQAESVSLDNQQPDAALLRLMLTDQRPLTYRIENGGILREHQQSDEQTQREFFAFPDDYSLQFAQLSEPARITLTLEHDTQLAGIAPQIRLHVEAVVGQFLRLRQSGGDSPRGLQSRVFYRQGRQERQGNAGNGHLLEVFSWRSWRPWRFSLFRTTLQFSEGDSQ